eukprot:scaffold1130_cov195-Pinguiococcus_pyrenoidosus.AAC.6
MSPSCLASFSLCSTALCSCSPSQSTDAFGQNCFPPPALTNDARQEQSKKQREHHGRHVGAAEGAARVPTPAEAAESSVLRLPLDLPPRHRDAPVVKGLHGLVGHEVLVEAAHLHILDARGGGRIAGRSGRGVAFKAQGGLRVSVFLSRIIFRNSWRCRQCAPFTGSARTGWMACDVTTAPITCGGCEVVPA